MALATIKLVQSEIMFRFYFTEQPDVLARELLEQGLYATRTTIKVDGEGESAAEEAFDLTNNPSRQAEREMVYGRGRSLSVGDIVNVDGVDFLCCNFGWKAI